MLIIHSDLIYFNIFLSHSGTLLSLLIQLVKLSPSVCEPDHFAIWLSSYKASMSSTDRQLLHLMYLYELNNVSTIKYR